MSTAIITTDTYLDLAMGALPYAELSSLMRTARRSISTKATARDLGWLICRGYGYNRAASLNPFFAGPMAAAYDAGVAAYEIECPAEFDSDDYSDITTTTTETGGVERCESVVDEPTPKAPPRVYTNSTPWSATQSHNVGALAVVQGRVGAREFALGAMAATSAFCFLVALVLSLPI